MTIRSLFESEYPSKRNTTNIIAVVHTDGLWSFPRCLSEELQYNKKYRTSEALEIIEEISPDVMLQHIQCEKKYTYNALFEILNIPYIGSDSQVSANIVDKGKTRPQGSGVVNSVFLGVTRAILAQAGVGVPSGVVITRNDDSSDYRAAFPAVVKPTRMENSVGVSLVRDRQEMEAALESCWSYGDTAVIDTFIPGREVRCGAVELMEGKVEALGCIEYKVARDTIRTYGDKLEGDDDQLRQAVSTTSWFIEETEEPELVRKLQKIAIKIHRVMGCRDFSQYDCRYERDYGRSH